jgi:hypothetical protein
MKSYRILPVLAVILMIGCNERKEEKQEPRISAISIIKGQLNKLDSSLYEFKKIERTEIKSDTTYLRRDEIRKLAAPFLSLPDIADQNLYKKYSEERLIQADQETLSITSTLKENEEGEIQRQMLIVGLSDISNAQVNSIFIDTYMDAGDSTIEKKLVWEIDKYFTIYTTVQKENQAVKNYFTKVEWQ